MVNFNKLGFYYLIFSGGPEVKALLRGEPTVWKSARRYRLEQQDAMPRRRGAALTAIVLYSVPDGITMHIFVLSFPSFVLYIICNGWYPELMNVFCGPPCPINSPVWNVSAVLKGDGVLGPLPRALKWHIPGSHPLTANCCTVLPDLSI